MWYCQQQECRLWDSLATRPIQTSSVHIGPHADFRPGFAAESDSEMAPQLIENARSGVGNGSRPLPWGKVISRKKFDLMSGYAGAIVTLVVLHAVLGDFQLLDSAVRFGDELIKMADKSDGRYSWQSSAVRSYHNLTGFSHGAAGAGYALLELYEATGTDAYRKAALCAFAYERSHFQTSESNWPDFRRDADSRRPRRFPCLSFWCHGAPGISLSRLRAYELLGDQQFKTEAIIALGTTRRSIESALASSAGN
jgi:class II lanthipeptide synthase